MPLSRAMGPTWRGRTWLRRVAEQPSLGEHPRHTHVDSMASRTGPGLRGKAVWIMSRFLSSSAFDSCFKGRSSGNPVSGTLTRKRWFLTRCRAGLFSMSLSGSRLLCTPRDQPARQSPGLPERQCRKVLWGGCSRLREDGRARVPVGPRARWEAGRAQSHQVRASPQVGASLQLFEAEAPGRQRLLESKGEAGQGVAALGRQRSRAFLLRRHSSVCYRTLPNTQGAAF